MCESILLRGILGRYLLFFGVNWDSFIDEGRVIASQVCTLYMALSVAILFGWFWLLFLLLLVLFWLPFSSALVLLLVTEPRLRWSFAENSVITTVFWMPLSHQLAGVRQRRKCHRMSDAAGNDQWKGVGEDCVPWSCCFAPMKAFFAPLEAIQPLEIVWSIMLLYGI